MAAGGEGGAAQDEVGGVLRCSETQLAGGVAGGCAIHPASKPRGVSLQAITANRRSNWWEGLPRHRNLVTLFQDSFKNGNEAT